MKPRQRPDSEWDFNSEKWNLWPWKHWMTIGIGVLACEGREKPDHLILCCDALGSFDDTSSTASLHKLFTEREANLYAVAAHDIGKAAELLRKIVNTVMERGGETYGKIYDSICIATHAYKNARFRYEVLPLYDIAPEQGWKKEAKKLGFLDPLLQDVWPKFSIECQLIIGTFAEDGSSHLFWVQQNGFVHPITLPGFCVIGSGATNANFWLCYRDQSLDLSLRRSAYHTFEAKLMAERSPHVGKDDIEMLIVPPDREHFLLTPEHPERPNCPVSLTEMKALFTKFGPQKTDHLDLRS
jgi:hypothetical protein